MTRKSLKLQLNDDQRAAIKAAIGKDAEAIEFEVEELEERIAPARWGRMPGLGR